MITSLKQPVERIHFAVQTSTSELVDFIEDVVDELGSRQEIEYLRMLIEDPRGMGADRQLAIYKQTGDLNAVTRFLIQQTKEGIM